MHARHNRLTDVPVPDTFAPVSQAIATPSPVWDGTPFLRGAMLTSLATFALITGIRSPGNWDMWIDGILFNVPMLLAAVVCFRRPFGNVERGLPWYLLGAGILFPALGNLVEAFAFGGDQQGVGIADWLFLAAYPCLFAAVGSLLRQRIVQDPRSVWFDGAISAMGVIAISIAALYPAIELTDTSPLMRAVNLAYPAGDVALAALVATVVTVAGWRGSVAFAPLLTGLACLAVSDGMYFVLTAHGNYREGGGLDVGWPLGMSLLAMAAWRASATPPVRSRGVTAVTMPTIFTLASLAVLVSGSWRPLPSGAALLCGSTIALALLRVLWTHRELDGLVRERRLARTDDLTGMPNRREFIEHAERAIRQRSVDRPLSLVIIDLDGFKDVNDSLGHEMGDVLLRTIGQRIAAMVDRAHLVARIGGDEFAIVVDGDLADAECLAERIRPVLSRPLNLAGFSATIEGSFGIAQWPSDGAELDELISSADIAMYAAKQGGTGVERFRPERDQASKERFALVQALRGALRDSELRLHYQPQVRIADGAVVGVEALVRWPHPQHGLLTSAQFLPLAEQAGLMDRLADVVLDRAAEQYRTWRDAGLDFRVAVNVSATNLRDAGFAARVAQTLAAHGMPPSDLVIEITEDTLITNRSTCVKVLEDLRGLGVSIAVDDFGVGHSSLAYLHELPVDELKLDRSLIVAAETDERAAAIVSAALSLARALGLHVVAEGIETAGGYRRLAQLRCDTAQGDFLCPAVAPEDLAAWLDVRRRQTAEAGSLPVAPSFESAGVGAST